MFSYKSTLGKIETTLQIGEALEKVRVNAILNHTHKSNMWLRDQNYLHSGVVA